MARLYVAILGLLLVVIAGFVAASQVEDRTGAGGSPAASASPGAAAGSGRPVALAPAHLPQYVGRPVQGRSALVQSIAGVGPAGQPDARRFFVGSSPRQQILVVIDTAANPAVAIVAGQRYSFSGVLRKYGGNPAPLHISQGATASVAQLGYYVEVADPHLVKAG